MKRYCNILHFFLDRLREFKEEADMLVRNSVAATTRRLYDAAVDRLMSFCREQGIKDKYYFHSQTIELFVVHLRRLNLGFGAIQSNLSALRHHCNSRNISKDFDTPRLTLLLKGVKRLQEPSKRTTNGLNLGILCRLLDAMSALDRHTQLWTKAVFSLAFFAFLRPCEMATAHATPQHQLRRKAVKFTNKAVLLTFTSFKHSAGKTEIVRVKRMPGRTVCPWENLWSYLSTVTLGPEDLLFPFTVSTVQALLDRCVRLIGYDNRLTLHSFRRGGATWASLLGWSTTRIQAHGRWKSDGYRTYIKAA